MLTLGHKNSLSRYVDVAYFVKFAAILLVLYYGNLFFIAITDTNGRLYSPFLDKHVNYINWLRNSYLFSSSFFTNLLGVKAQVTYPFKITAASGAYVQTVYECLGIGLFSFWSAFVWANNQTLTQKIKWWLIGIAAFWLINTWRMTLLLIALEKHWQYNKYLDHHTSFNLVAYALMAVFIYLYIKTPAEKQVGDAVTSTAARHIIL